MSSSIEDMEIQRDKEFQGFIKNPFPTSPLQTDSSSPSLDSVRQNMLRSLSTSPSGLLEDHILMNSLPLASKLLIESFEDMENILVRDSTNCVTADDARSKINLWQSSLEPWHELLKQLRNFGLVPCDSVQKLLNSLPGVFQAIFSHCKRSECLYGPKFSDVRLQLTSLYRQTDVILDVFFSIIDNNIKFHTESKSENNALETVLDKIGNIAVLTNGMDLKTLISTWKVFAKLATNHESYIITSGSTECITRRYADIAKNVETLLFASVEEKKAVNYERTIKCVALLLKILGRLCMIYRGYCGNKVSTVLVELLTKLYRYSPPFVYERFIPSNSKIVEYSEMLIVPATADLLNILLKEKEFSQAFFQYGKSKLDKPICYHLLTLRIIEELFKDQQSDLSSWLQKDNNMIDVALTNMNLCCEDVLIKDLRIPVRSAIIFGELDHLGFYEITLGFICHFISRNSLDDFPVIEIVLLKHLLSGDFWSSLLSCDAWTFLGRIASLKLCYEHLCILIKVQKILITRRNSLEFEIISNLIGRLYKLLPKEIQESVFNEIEVHSDRHFVIPFGKSLPLRVQQYLCQQSSIDETNNLAEIFQNLCQSPSVKNWTRLTSLLRSIGVAAVSKDRIACLDTIRNIWSFLASSIPKTEGINREMLLDVAILLFDCTRPDSSDDSSNDRLIASIYDSMLKMAEHLPIHHHLRMNIFLRDNLEPYINESGKQSLSAITELFCYLINVDNPWIRQEFFETYAEYVIKNSSIRLFDALSIGINRYPIICRQMQLYLSNKEIDGFSRYSSLNNYLHELAKLSTNHSIWHKCYEPDFRQRDEKMPRLEIKRIDERVDDICNEIRYIAKRKNELSDSSMNKLRRELSLLVEENV